MANTKTILDRRLPRDLKHNITRYGALLLLIALCMYFVVGLVAAAQSVTDTVERNAQESYLEEGQFSTLVALTSEQEDELVREGIALESMSSVDRTLDDGSTLRVFKDREQINRVHLDEGSPPLSSDEIVLEKLYAQAHGYGLGSALVIDGIRFVVSGIGSSPDYDLVVRTVTDTASDKARFGIAFVAEEAHTKLLENSSSKQEDILYAYMLNGFMTHEELREKLDGLSFDRDKVTDRYYLELLDRLEGPKNELLDGSDELASGSTDLADSLTELGNYGESLAIALRESGVPPEVIEKLSLYAGSVRKTAEGADRIAEGTRDLDEGLRTFIEELDLPKPSNVTSFVEAADNIRIGASVDDVTVNKMGGIIGGIIALILFAYVISVFIVHAIDRESEIIGTLYALGVKRRELLAHYLELPCLIALLGGIAGTLIGFSPWGAHTQMSATISYYSFPDPTVSWYSYLLAYGILLPPLLTLIVGTLVIRKRLARPPLTLLRKEQSDVGTSKRTLPRTGFINRFRIRQVLREKRAAFTIAGGMLVSLLLVMLGLVCYALITNIAISDEDHIRYEYMTTLKYPPETVPANTAPAYMLSLQKDVLGYSHEVSLMGIAADNPYFDFTPARGKRMLTVTTAAASKFDLAVGDTVFFNDKLNDTEYSFTVDAIVPYSSELYVFMDIDSMRALLGLEDDAYNVILSDTKPDIDEGRISASMTKDDVREHAAVFMRSMTPMITMMVSVSALVFVVVLYLMVKVMIDRATTGISLVKIFGYSDREVRKLYLDGTLWVVLISMAVTIPLSKVIIDALYPLLVANVGIGLYLELPLWVYLTLVACIAAIYFCVVGVLMRKVRAITPVEALKNRE